MRTDYLILMDCFYRLSPPSEKELANRAKAIAAVKKKYADKMLLNKVMPRLTSPL